MQALNPELQSKDIKADTWAEPIESWLSNLLSSTYEQAVRLPAARLSNITTLVFRD